VTDIAGFAAGIYKRGIRCGFVPTSILAMVDAAIGGKNGLDIGEYKNMMGLIRQPDFLLYDFQLLETLPHEEWVNGFAEIIKHACIKDEDMFRLLQRYSLHDFRNDKSLLQELIQRNALLKADVVLADEQELGERKKLNFGHTLAHAIENIYELPHGHAVSIGMVFAAQLSEQLLGFADVAALTALLEKYELPLSLDYNREQALSLMLADKKRAGDKLQYILLQQTGQAVIYPIAIDALKTFIPS